MAADAASSVPPDAASVLSFWFGPDYARVAADPLAWPAEGNKRWFFGGEEVDAEIKAQFLPLIDALSSPSPPSPSPLCWLDDDLAKASDDDASFLPLRALAGVIAMDQFSRNAFRGTPRAFALDEQALRWSRALVGAGLHRRLAPAARLFLLLPFEHSEDLEMQRESLRLFEEMAKDAAEAAAGGGKAGAGAEEEGLAAVALQRNTQGTLDFARKHLEVIERWGRFPGRNAALGRESTVEEAEGLANGTIAKW
jgi:uncharacterized protein (DUF924 family)